MTSNLSLDDRAPLALFPFWERWCHSGAGPTVTQKLLKPWGIRAKGQKPPFCRSWVFCLSRGKHLASQKAHGLTHIIPGGEPWAPSCRKRPTPDSLDPLSTAPRSPSCLPLSYHLSQMPVPWEPGKHIPRLCGLKRTKGSLQGSTSPLSLPTCPAFDLSGNGCSLARFINEKMFQQFHLTTWNVLWRRPN